MVVDDVDAVHASAVEQGFEIAYPLHNEEWGVRRFMLREPGGTIVNVLSHLSPRHDRARVRGGLDAGAFEPAPMEWRTG